MIKTPKSLRLQIGIFGRTNVGKSSILNMISNQDAAMTSPVPGTTTDVVEKSMELLPIGPVTLLDTAGTDDMSELSIKRIERSEKIFDRADIGLLVTEAGQWTEFEIKIMEKCSANNIPVMIIINKSDIQAPDKAYLDMLRSKTEYILICSATDIKRRDQYIRKFKDLLLEILPDEFSNPPRLTGDLINPQGLVVSIVPIDIEAPKGRIILPQVQVIRDVLDHSGVNIVVKESEYPAVLDQLNAKPDLVICDSQVVDHMVANTPEDIPCTTFSILFSRYKGDLVQEVRGVAAARKLRPDSRVLIAEACSHHPMEDDIGRVKIPKWLGEYLGFDVTIDVFAGRDFPEDLSEFDLVIHCGGCMLTRTEKLVRLHKAGQAEVPITNYGILISLTQGVLERVLGPFPEALKELS